MTDLISTLSCTTRNWAWPDAMLVVFDGVTQDPVRGRLCTVQKDMDRALPRTRLFRL